jgi:hypothetical protein
MTRTSILGKTEKNKGSGIAMTNRNDNRERKNKYPNNKERNISKDVNIRSEMTKKDLKE